MKYEREYLFLRFPHNVLTRCYVAESESLEATVQFDFRARSQREVSLRKGQHVTLYNQVSNDWWRGSVAGHEGLIPDKYIMLKIK